jgi:hypothetical protein
MFRIPTLSSTLLGLRSLLLLAGLCSPLVFLADPVFADCGLNCVGLSCYYGPAGGKYWRVTPDPCNRNFLAKNGCAYPYCNCTGQSALLTFIEQDPARVTKSCPQAGPSSVQASGCPADKDGGTRPQDRCCASCAIR